MPAPASPPGPAPASGSTRLQPRESVRIPRVEDAPTPFTRSGMYRPMEYLDETVNSEIVDMIRSKLSELDVSPDKVRVTKELFDYLVVHKAWIFLHGTFRATVKSKLDELANDWCWGRKLSDYYARRLDM